MPRPILALLALPFLVVSLHAEPPDTRALQQAVVDLGDTRYPVREKAAQTLWFAGKSAIPFLEIAAQSDDLEIAARARQILADFQLGLYPDTPPAILEQARLYRRGDRESRGRALSRLWELGKPAAPILARLTWTEENPAQRAELFKDVAARAEEATPGALADGDLQLAQAYVEIAATDAGDDGERNLAALLLAQGKLQARLDDAEARLKAGGFVDPTLLAILRRAAGDLPGARAAAEKSNDAALIDNILFEQGDWPALALRHSGDANADDVKQMGFVAACQRLAGNANACDKVLERMVKLAEKNGDAAVHVANALLLNDRPEAAFKLLGKTGNAPRLMDLLVAQQRYADAMDLARQAPNAEGLRPGLVRVCALLGMKAETENQLAVLRNPGGAAAAGLATGEIVLLERDIGRDDAAFDDAAAILAASNEGALALLEILFPDRGMQALAWWSYLREQAKAEPAPAMKRLRQIMNHAVRGEELDKLAKEAADSLTLNPQMGLRGLAATLIDAGRDEAAAALLTRAVSLGETADDDIQLAQIASRRKQWTSAAELYAKAFAHDRINPIPLYFRGHSLVQAGQREEGERIMRLASLLPLADESRRYQLALAQDAAGFRQAAQEQYDLILTTGAFNSWEVGIAMRRAWIRAQGRGDFAGANILVARSILDCLYHNTSYTEPGSYLVMPSIFHRNQALAHIQAGHLAEAQKELDTALRLYPQDDDLPILGVALFEAGGHRQEADALFEKCVGMERKLLEQYPRSATLNNAVAWLEVRCHRNLEDALAKARLAAELSPRSTPILDTLAEVQFQLGHKEEAIATIQRCIQLEPRNHRHELCIERFRSGNPSTPPPSAE